MSTIAHWRRRFKSASKGSRSVMAVLSPEEVEGRCREHGHRWRRSPWEPSAVLTTFLFQTVNPSKTLRAAVGDRLDQLASDEPGDVERWPSRDPSAYCAARRRLPRAVIAATFAETTRRIAELADGPSRWHGRRVTIMDGSSVSMPDEPELQAEFPQHPGQRPGCGFPQMNLLASFCWATGALVDIRMGSIHDSERSMLRTMMDRLGRDDLVLADRGFCSYVDIARLKQRGADAVVRQSATRSADFRTGKRLGHDDRVVVWHRPKWTPSCGLTREQFEALPPTMELRMVRITSTPPGFRSRTIVVVTTILDPDDVSADDLRELYRDRWMAELNLRSLKTHMGMEVLRGKSVDVVRKEVLMHALAYNLIRLLIWEAARATGRKPARLSFTGTLHRLHSIGRSLLSGKPSEAIEIRLLLLLQTTAADLVPERPGRREPRRVKRRPKQYSRLTKPRSHYRRHGDPGGR